jgi:hypothetical protein
MRTFTQHPRDLFSRAEKENSLRIFIPSTVPLNSPVTSHKRETAEFFFQYFVSASTLLLGEIAPVFYSLLFMRR